MKAYKITTVLHEPGEYMVYSAENASKAKNTILKLMKWANPFARYQWITSCTRHPTVDALAEQYPDQCIISFHNETIWVKGEDF